MGLCIIHISLSLRNIHASLSLSPPHSTPLLRKHPRFRNGFLKPHLPQFLSSFHSLPLSSTLSFPRKKIYLADPHFPPPFQAPIPSSHPFFSLPPRFLPPEPLAFCTSYPAYILVFFPPGARRVVKEGGRGRKVGNSKKRKGKEIGGLGGGRRSDLSIKPPFFSPPSPSPLLILSITSHQAFLISS